MAPHARPFIDRLNTYTFDDLNRLSTIENPCSGITTYVHDALDDVVSVINPLNLTTTIRSTGSATG